jgi:hypothetical protein
MVELIVTVVLLGVVCAGTYGILMTIQRTYRAQTQRIDLQQSLRAVVSILPAELRELDAADGDIGAMSSTSLTIRAMRQLGFLCATPEPSDDGQQSLIVRQRPFFGVTQSFTAGDSVLLYYEGDPATRNDDGWLRGEVAAVSNENCPDPDHSRPGYRVTLRLERTGGDESDLTGAITSGSPVRGFTTVTYASYRSPGDHQWYLGQELAGQRGTVQPLVGPLIGPSGLTFGYFDGNGSPTTTPAAVREIEIRARGRTALPVRGGRGAGMAYLTDSVVTRVALRNNPRW